MKKFLFLLIFIIVGATSFAQVRAKVVIGHQPPHRHYVHHRYHPVRHRHYYHRRHGARVVVRGKL